MYARENLRNVFGLTIAWIGFLCWFTIGPHLPYHGVLLALTPLVSLAFQQYLSGVIHEGAHALFIQRNRKLNELVVNWAAAYVFLYGLDAYRFEHFRHHRNTVFCVIEDRETFQYAAKRGELGKGFSIDLLGLTALGTFLIRTGQPAEYPDSLDERAPPPSRWSVIVPHFFVLWTTLAWLGSPLFVLGFFFSLGTLYMASNRIRVWGTHGDLYKKDGLQSSEVARNLLSPVWERIFIGNRMMMYHHEHHLAPYLTFRQCESAALSRYRESQALPQRPLDYNVQVPSYFFFIKHFLAKTFNTPAQTGN